MIDWSRAKRLYRQGEISIREIARREGVSEGAVRKRAKAQGWERESASPVRREVRSEVEQPAASGTPASAEQSRPDAEDDPEATEWDDSEAPEWMRQYFADRARFEASGAQAVVSIRLRAHTDPDFKDAFRIFTDAGGYLLAIGREPKLAAARRLLEEGLAMRHSKVELVFVETNVSVFFTVGDVVG